MSRRSPRPSTDDAKSSLGTTVLSSGAFLVIALALAGVCWWLSSVLFMTQESAAQYGSRASGRAGRATAGLGLGLIAAAIGALFFAAVGAFTLWLGVTDFRKKKPQSDDSWKDMPYPKG